MFRVQVGWFYQSHQRVALQVYKMATKENTQIRDILKSEELGSRTFPQQFQFYNNSIFHENHLEMTKTQIKSEGLKIKNQYATIHEDKVIKVTEILIEDKVVKVVDTFDLRQLPVGDQGIHRSIQLKHQSCQLFEEGNVSQGLQNKQKVLVEQRQTQTKEENQLIKNIVHVFQNWAKEHCLLGEQAEQSIKKILKTRNGKYSDRLIKTLQQQWELRDAFLAFCNSDASTLMNKMKGINRETHFKVLRQYQDLCLRESSGTKKEVMKITQDDEGQQHLKYKLGRQ